MRNKLLAAIAAVTMFGCGADDSYDPMHNNELLERRLQFAKDGSHFDTSHSIPCVGRVTSDDPISETSVLQAIVNARDILDSHGLVPREVFCNAFKSEPIYIHNTMVFVDEHWGEVSGLHTHNVKIELNDRVQSLVHEFLHHWDAIYLVNSAEHKGWETNGYQDASNDYRIIPLDVCYVEGDEIVCK